MNSLILLYRSAVRDGTPMHPFITILFLLMGVCVFILFIIAIRTKVVYKKGDPFDDRSENNGNETEHY